MYTVHAHSHSTDLGQIATARTLLGAVRAGRRAILTMLPGGEGTYEIRTVFGPTASRVVTVRRERRDLRSEREWYRTI